MSETISRLRARSEAVGVPVPQALEERLAAYFDLLFRWNTKINLTSLTDTDAAIDRLLLEPVAAAAAVPRGLRVIDIGSGGGSPAIPLALASEACKLVMVESIVKKAAFLREAARVVELPATVEAERFEVLAEHATYRGTMDLVSIRAVRMDPASIRTVRTFLVPDGVVALFSSSDVLPAEFSETPMIPYRALPLFGTTHLLLLA
ncbi:MAG TPA: RsmG family class I SAM-dependent methyltransferase [Vicinamibacterales bacterium]|nr:RsmG family class I SAM-dependent methyltransferase [Vicinamibacterales bacterium]